jgi:hypothetical protein
VNCKDLLAKDGRGLELRRLKLVEPRSDGG